MKAKTLIPGRKIHWALAKPDNTYTVLWYSSVVSCMRNFKGIRRYLSTNRRHLVECEICLKMLKEHHPRTWFINE